MKKTCLTKRAPDGWDSARFTVGVPATHREASCCWIDHLSHRRLGHHRNLQRAEWCGNPLANGSHVGLASQPLRVFQAFSTTQLVSRRTAFRRPTQRRLRLPLGG
jgi:hypothetical protein